MNEPRLLPTENESHTPGPWLLNADAARHEPGFYGSPSEPGYPEVYTSIHVGQVRLTAFIKPADARLIVAAPDLLDLAERCASECADCGGDGKLFHEEGGFKGDCDACAEIRAVIAKAKGESHV